MSLTPRQLRFYQDIIDIYKPETLDHTSGGFVADVRYNPTPVATSVPCLYMAKTEIATGGEVGRENQDMIFTFDEFHVESSTDLEDMYLIRLMTPGHPQLHDYWKVVGNAKIRVSRTTARKPNMRLVYAKATLRPPGGLP